MRHSDLLHIRLENQRLEGQQPTSPVDVIRQLGGVQAQDFGGASWAVCQRTRDMPASDFIAMFAAGEILRTHVMRPTWHFVAAEDIDWMLDLTRDRLLQAVSYYYRQYELNADTFITTDSIIQRALEGGNQLTRSELAATLAAQGINVADTVRLAHIVGHAETLGIICSGVPRGKQQTYALLSERVQQPRKLTRSEAITELARRYFTSHGPATLEDYAWWSGLTKADARAGLESIQNEFVHESLADKIYWFAPSTAPITPMHAHLLPNYDEYVVAYANREALFDATHTNLLNSRQNPLFSNVLIIDGVIAGTWTKTVRRKNTTVTINAFKPLSTTERTAVQVASQCYANYNETPELILNLS